MFKLIKQKQVQYDEAMRLHDVVKLFDERLLAIDGGAHIGSFTILMAKYFDVVHAFEPCKESFAILKANALKFVRKEDVHLNLHNKALMDQACMVDVVAPRPKRQVLTARQTVYGTETPAIAIDDLELEACSLIKLDLEGNELNALKGARKTIKKFKPFLLVEFNPTVGSYGQTEQNLAKFIRKLGYSEVFREGVDRGFKYVG